MTAYSPPFYFHTMFDITGVVTANNFMSVFNPASSGRIAIFYQAEFASYAVGVSVTQVSMTATRISAASGGTQLAAANVSRFLTTWPDPVCEVRHSNPTVTTVGLPLNAWVPPLSASGAFQGSTAYTSTPPGAGFVCAPGQGLVFATAAGNVNQRWKINVIWAERGA